MSKKKKEQKKVEKESAAKALDSSPKVKMKFNRSMFYNDPKIPLYEKDTVYDIEPRMVDRWLKRGGQIVEDIEPEKPVEPEEKDEQAEDDKE